MILGWNEIKKRAMAFSKKWKDATDEFAEAQSYLNDFFEVFGVDRKRVATFETKVTMSNRKNGYIDLLWKGVILIEMKSAGKDLEKAHTQANGYAFHLEDEELPEYIMVSDFKRIKLYNQVTGQEWIINLKDLHNKVKLFAALAGYKAAVELPTNKEVDIKAAEKMAKLHDILKAHGYDGHELEVYLVRLLFCLFADDTGIFEQNIFFDYISQSKPDGSDLSFRLAKLFEVLDTPPEERAKQSLLSNELKRFAYVNGRLFSEKLSLADFDLHMRKIILDSATLDWGFISPAIFGSIFQGVMNPEERREIGAHYTSEENILKLIKPLFLDELRDEFEKIRGNSKQLIAFHEKLEKLKFLDPACGCGNFLIITYRELRRLELEVLKMIIDTGGQLMMDLSPFLKVNVDQFYGIEVEEFPAQIAQVGMWLMDHQMNTVVAEHFGLYYARLPLRRSATIVTGNALRIDWGDIVPQNELSYILGNPPFIGTVYMSLEQKKEMANIFTDKKRVGILDYVSAWYMKAAEYIHGTTIKVAFVSTNSITQGEQVPSLWKDLIEKKHIEINFAYRTFKWSNDAKGKAAVHCVIIGFSQEGTVQRKLIFNDNIAIVAKNINAYLVDAPNEFIESKSTPIMDVPKMIKGSQPTDGGHLILNDEEKIELIANEPIAEHWIRPYIGAYEFINKKNRWCLWLVGVSPTDIQKCKSVMDRIGEVRKFRLNSKKLSTVKSAQSSSLFTEIRQPASTYIIVPRVSSEKRNYIPIGFVDGNAIASDAVLTIPNATLYHFGVLTSKVHMAWMRTVAGRLKSDYRYSASIVYNNFPWPNPTEKQKELIDKSAQEVLAARALYSESSLADLYDPLTMPTELVKAHNNLDKAVVAAYGGEKCNSEAERVADLMKRYQKLIDKKKEIRIHGN